MKKRVRSSQSGYDAEVIALDILKNKEFEIVFSQVQLDRERKKNEIPLAESIDDQHRLERMGWMSRLLNPVILPNGKKFFSSKTLYHEIVYKKGEIPNWLKKIPISTPKEVERLKEKFWKHEYKHRELVEYEKEQKKMMLKIIGKSIIPKSSEKSLQESIDREKDPDWKIYWRKISDKELTFVDVFCKKNDKYYVFDVKFKNGRELYEKNSFDITNFEALNYTNIVKKNKVELVILIIIKDGKNYRFAFKKWSDFIINPKYNPHEKPKTKVKMKTLTPFEELEKHHV